MKIGKYKGLKFNEKGQQMVEDHLAREIALQILVNNLPFSVTMCSPGDETELVRGLLYTEDIFTETDFPFKLEPIKEDKPSAITKYNVSIPENLLKKPYLNSKSLLSVSSCGICGNKELELVRPAQNHFRESEKFDLQNLWLMFENMKQQQFTFQESGGTHAAAAFTFNAGLLSVKEDIGRHNAVDKVIGHLLMKSQLPQAKVLLVSSRVSYEIIAKCYKAKIPVLAAVSAPSSLAVDFAKELGITLLAFCREGRATLYTGAERIQKNINFTISPERENII